MSIFRRRLMMGQKEDIREYIQDGLVFRLVGTDFDSENGTWTDKVDNATFTMTDCTASGKGVDFNGTSSYGYGLPSFAPTYTQYTIEVVFKIRSTGQQAIVMPKSGSNLCLTHRSASGNDSLFNILRNGSTQVKKTYGPKRTNKTVTMSVNTATNYTNLTSYSRAATERPTGNAGYFSLGCVLNGSTKSYYFNGIIYEVRYYNRQLTVDEILYNQRIDISRYKITV